MSRRHGRCALRHGRRDGEASRTGVESVLCARLERYAKTAAAMATKSSFPAAAKYAVRSGKAPQESANQASLWNRPRASSRLYATTMNPPIRTKAPIHGSNADRPGEADRDSTRNRCDRESHEHRARDPRLQRPPVELVQRVRADPHGQEESGDRGEEAVPCEGGGQRCADGDVAQMPGRVGQVEQRDVVPPAPGGESVERGTACLSLHGRPTSRSRHRG